MTGKEAEMAAHRTVNANEDPVCGMTVDPAEARSKGLATTLEGTDYVFCGKGCFLEFRDDPETFLAPGYTPGM
jgi:YHS domain-containing protein